MKYRILNRILNITFKYQKLKHYKSLWTLSQYKAATWAESLLGASSGVGPGAVKIQFNLIFFNLTNLDTSWVHSKVSSILFNLTNLFLFRHQLGAVKIQFNLIQQICFDLEIHNSSLLVCFPSDKFGRRPSILIAAVIQVLFQFILSVFDLLSYRWVCTNVLVATCIFLTRGTFPNCSIENIHLVSEICIIWSSIPISFSVRLLRTFFWFCKSSYELRY